VTKIAKKCINNLFFYKSTFAPDCLLDCYGFKPVPERVLL